jgi:hypothetical protein
VVSDGLEPGKTYRLNWTRVVGNRMTGTGWQELLLRTPWSRATSRVYPSQPSSSRPDQKETRQTTVY